MTRDKSRSRVRDALRRLLGVSDARDDAPRTRISTVHYRRSHEVVSPERDASEWVHQRMKSDWDNVVKGKNKE